jgi:hypothetical protein
MVRKNEFLDFFQEIENPTKSGKSGRNLRSCKNKLVRPWISDDMVSRPHLIEQLDRGLNRKLTLLSAPAGFGKTTPVTLWVRSCNRPTAWLSRLGQWGVYILIIAVLGMSTAEYVSF